MSERRTDDATLIAAVRILSRTIQTEDGVIGACLAEAASRLETLLEELESVACRAAGAEADAWGVRRNGLVDSVAHRSFRSSAEHSAEQWGGTVVPLYAAPQPAKGWLTPEEREAIEWAADAAYDKQHPAEDTLRPLLARSTPPEVVLPNEFVVPYFDEVQIVFDASIVRHAIRAAGVKTKEVGRE